MGACARCFFVFFFFQAEDGIRDLTVTGVQTCALPICLSESNRHLNLGKVPYYHYTKAAQRPSFYSTTGTAATSLPRPSLPRVKFAAGKKGQDTWVIRADFTTGERRWRSAKRVALFLSV